MSIELCANNAYSTLASGIASGDLSLTVASGHGARFRTVGSDFYFLTLDDGANIEIVKVTALSTDTFTIVRAQQGTSATSFSTGTSVEQRLTRETLETLQAGGAPTNADYLVETANASLSAEVVTGTTFITTAAYGSRQAAAKSGRIFLPNDGFYVQRDSGSAWASWGPLYPFTAPVSGDFSSVNFTGSTLTTTYGGMHIQSPSNSSAQSLRLYAKTLPSAPYTLTVAVAPVLHYLQFSQCCVGLRDTGTDDSVLFMFKSDGSAFVFTWEKWTSNTSGATGSYISTASANFLPNQCAWIRIQDDNANRLLSWSMTGREGSFVEIHSVGRTDHLTPNQFCFGTNPFSQITGITLLSYKETQP